MSEKKDYFDYVENVLGVKSLLLDQTKDQAQTQIKTPLLVAIENYADYTSEEKDLLVKMIAALKIDLEKIKVTDENEIQNYTADFILGFADSLNLNAQPNKNKLTTYSPRALLKKPEHKKSAWNDLQKVISHFKHSN